MLKDSWNKFKYKYSYIIGEFGLAVFAMIIGLTAFLRHIF